MTFIHFLQLIKEKKFETFTPYDLERSFDISKKSISKFLHRGVKEKFFIRAKRGLYLFTEKQAEFQLFLANKLYRPSYLSFDWALSYYHIIPESIYSITSATTKSTREFFLNEQLYQYFTLKQKAFTGYRPKDVGGKIVLLADSEKALTDYLYFVCLGKRKLNDRMDLADLNKKRVLYYAKLYDRPKLIQLIKEIWL